jgi:tetratricopeptide (TPR) repeat protein
MTMPNSIIGETTAVSHRGGDPYCRQLPEVLMVRLGIYSALQKWDLLQTVAKKLNEYDPDEIQPWITLAYATRRLDSIDAAKEILLEALARHTKEPVFHFNLACYECQLGDLTAARSYLAAFEIDPRWRLFALEDEDLAPLWDLIKPTE